MKKLGLLMAFGMVLGLFGNSYAQSSRHAKQQNHNINKRQARQSDRIQNGVQNKQLTPKETQQLIRQEARISDLEAKLRESGGKLTPKERAKLERALDKESRNIYRQKHDKQGKNPAYSGINQQQENQIDRIENGVQNGSLTPMETQRLIKQEARIADLEAKYRATGGKLTVRERAELNYLLNTESHRIYRQKHDAQGNTP